MKKRFVIASLILIIVVGIAFLACSWHKPFDASVNPNLTLCVNHIDANFDMACDSCAQILPFSAYSESKEIVAVSDSEAEVKIKGSMIKDTLATSKELSRDKAISLAKSYVKDIADEDVLAAFDISLSSNAVKYQPKDFGQNVSVNISNLDLEIKDNLALLHIMDNGDYEILPVLSFNDNEIKFKATCFSTYILIAVESHKVSFDSDNNFKVYDLDDNEIVNGDSVASGTNFSFKVVPETGYAISNIVTSNYSGVESGDNYLSCVGSPFTYIGTINKVTQNLDIDITLVAVPNITKDLTTTKVKTGENAEFTVEAENATTFTWQYRENANDYWKEILDSIGTVTSSSNNSKLSIASASLDRNGYEFRCLLGNNALTGDYRIKTKVATLIVSNDIAITIPLIVKEPVTTKINAGENAEFTVEAENVTSFEWQYRASGDDYWKEISNEIGTVTSNESNSKLTIASASVNKNGYEFRCLLGNSTLTGDERIKTNVVNLIVGSNITTEVIYYDDENIFDDIYDSINKDTIKPIIQNPDITPDNGLVSSKAEVILTFEVIDDNYDYLNGSLLYPEDIKILIDGIDATTAVKRLSKEPITSGERFTLSIKNIWGSGPLSIFIPAGKITDLAKNTNDEYIITTEINVVRNLLWSVTNFSATSGDSPNSITITWEDNQNIGNVNYILEASTGDNNWVVLKQDATSPYTHSELSKNMSFEYRIKATASGEESPYVYTLGRTEYDPIFADVMIDTKNPEINFVGKDPEVDYIGASQEITLTFDSSDENYYKDMTNLTADKFIIISEDEPLTDVVRTLTVEDTVSGERFKLTLSNITGTGPLRVRVPGGVIIDAALNPNLEKEFDVGVFVMNGGSISDTAPTLNYVDGDIHSIIASNNQVSRIPIASIKYEYRLSGDGEFIVAFETPSGDIKISNLYSNTDYEVRTVVTDVANNSQTSMSAFITTKKIDASAIVITHATEEWTNLEAPNPKVVATIAWNDTKYTHEYSINNIDWQTASGTTSEINIEENLTVYARYFDGLGYSDSVEHEIKNIDKIKPSIGKVEVPSGKANTKVVTVSDLRDEGGSGVKGYSVNTVDNFENVTWTPISGDKFEFVATENTMYFIRIIDNAGNVSATEAANVTDIVGKVTNVNLQELLELNVFETKTPTLNYSGEQKEIVYTIENETIASINSTTGEVTGKASGETTITVTLTNFDGTKETDTCIVKVYAIEPTIAIDKNTLDFIYGGASKVINITECNTTGALTVTTANDKVATATVSNKVITVTPIGAGTTTITLKAEETPQYLSKEIQITVNVIKRKIDVSWSGDSFKYDGKEKEVTAIINNIVNEDSIVITYSGNKETDAGNYTAEITAIDNENYTIEGVNNLKHNWEITKADRTLEMIKEIIVTYGIPGHIEFTYDGEDVTAIIDSGDGSIITATYQDGMNKGDITVNVVKSGNQIVKVTIPESKNYNKAEGTVNVIAKLAAGDITVEEPNITFTYGDNQKQIEYEYPGNGEVTAESSDEAKATVTVDKENKVITVTPGKVGEATITIKAPQTEQFEAGEAKIKVVIIPRPIKASWSGEKFTYDGTEKKVSATITNLVGDDNVVITYSGDKAKNAGNYIAEIIKINNTNYTLTSGESLTHNWEIERADIHPTITMEDYVYGGVKSEPQITGNSGSGNVTYYYYASGDNISTAKDWATVTDSLSLEPGAYIMYADVAISANYNPARTNEVEFFIIVGNMDVTLTENGEEYDGDWTNNDILATVVIPDDVRGMTAIHYRFDGDDNVYIKSATSNTVEILFTANVNSKVYFTAVNVQGRPLTAEGPGYMLKIDKTKPSIGSISVPAGKANTKDILVSNIKDEGGSGIAGYYVSAATDLTGITWVPFSGDSFTYTVTENDKYYAFVIDNAGNISDVTATSQIIVEDIVDKISNIEHDASIEVTVFETVKPNITYSGEVKDVTYEIVNTDYASVDNNGNVTGKASGDTTLKVTFVDYDDTKTTIEISVKVLLAKPTLTLGSTEENFIYGAANKDITFTYTGNGVISGISSNENVVKVENIINEPSNKKFTLNPYKVGEAIITITASETPQYEAVGKTINVKVNPRVIEVSWGEDTFTYDGKVKEITAEITNLVSGDSVVINYSGNRETNAGNYKAEIIGVEDSNYTIEGAANLSKTWVINKAERPIVVLPSTQTVTFGDTPTITFTYSGEDTTATVISNNKNVADIETYTDENNSGTVVVKTVGAGEAKFTVIVPETDNYKSASGESIVIVEKNSSADIEIIDPPTEITYGDEPKEVEFNYPGNGTVTAITGNGDVVSVAVSGDTIIITPEGVGETTITVKAEETEQYTAEETTITIKVNPKPVELEWDYTAPFVYNGTSHKVTATVTNKVGTDKVNVNTYEENVKTNAGTYNAKALTLDNPNYTLEGAVNNLCTWVIEKAEREITMADSLNITFGPDALLSFTYTGEDVDAEVSIDAENFMKIKSFIDGINSGDITIETIGRGTSTVTVTVPQSDNYKEVTKTCEITVISADGGLVVNQPDINITYGDEPFETTYEYFGNGAVSGESSDTNVATVVVNNDGTIIITPVNAGETTITITTEETEQYKASEETINVTVKPRPVKLSWDEDSFVYDGTEKVVNATVVNKVENDSVNVIKYTNDSNKATKANEKGYTAIAESLDNANYTLVGGENISLKWYIMKADRELSISQNSITLEYGTNGTISYSYTGDTAPDSVIRVISSATNIAQVENVISGNGGTITVIPVAMGTAKGTVTIEATENYNAISKPFDIIINKNTAEKVKVDTENQNIEFTYGDSEKIINYQYNGNGEITAISTNENSITVEVRSGDKTLVITPHNAGTAQIVINAAETNQYAASSITINVTVKQKVVELSWSEDSFIYDGTTKYVTAIVTNPVNEEIVVVTEYKDNEMTLVGKYTAIAKSLNDSNYTLVGSTTATHEWEITKAELNPKIEMQDYIYGGDKKEPVITDNLENGTETIYVYASSEDETKAINWNLVDSSIYLAPGKYKMYATIGATENYESARTNTVEFEITILDIIVEITENGNPYNGAWTNNDVVAKITVPTEVTTMTSVFYRIEGETELINYDTKTIDGKVVTITFNKNINEEIRFVAVNVAGKPVTNESGIYTLKIDKTKPSVGKIEVIPTNDQLANSKLISVSNIADEGGSGILGYYVSTNKNIDDATWVPFSGDNFKYEVTENNTYFVFVKDNAGNISETTTNSTITVENIVDRVSNATIDEELVVEVNHTISAAASLKYDGVPKEVIYTIEDETYASVNSITGTITGNAAGDTKVIVTLKDYDGTVTVLEAKVKVLATDANLEVNDPKELVFIYGDNAKETSFSYDGNGEVIVSINDENIATFERIGNRIIVTPRKAGNTVVTILAKETPQFKAASTTIPVTVNPRPVNLTWSGDRFTFDGTVKTVTAKINNVVSGDTVNITYKDNQKVNAGNYTAIAESVDNPNYTVIGGLNITHNWIIEKAQRTINIQEELTLNYGTNGEIIFTYNGEDTNLVVVESSSIDVANVQYEDGDNGGKVTVIPVAAGSCNIIVTVPETDNYGSATAICKVTVVAIDPELTVKDSLIFTYGDPPVTETFSYTGNSNRIIPAVSDSKVVKATITGNQIIITPLAAGTAEITITAAATAQFNEVSATINVTVNPRPIEVTWGRDEFVFDGTHKTITIEKINNLVGADSVNVSYSGNTEINAGNYVAEITGVDNKNYTILGGKDITHNWVIKKADRRVDVQEEIVVKYGETEEVIFTYNGEDVTAKVTNQNDSVATITYVDGTKNGTITVKGESYGESIVTIEIPESDNYNASGDTFVIKVELAEAEITPSKSELTYIYGDSDNEIEYTYIGDGSVSVVSSNKNIVDAYITGNKVIINPGLAGTATLSLISTATNHYKSVTVEIPVTVKQRPVQLVWGETILSYTGTLRSVTATVVNVVDGDTVEVTAYEGNTAIEIGSYRAKATALSNNNYTLAGGINIETDWAIKEILPPTIIVRQGSTIIKTGEWASGDVTIEVEMASFGNIDVGYEYSYNGKDWREYTGVIPYTTDTTSQMFYAKAYNKANGVELTLIGEHELKVDKADPIIKINSVKTNETISGVVSKNSEITIELEVVDSIAGIKGNQFTAEDIKILTIYKGEEKELTGITKILNPDPSNTAKENGTYKYTLILRDLNGNGRLSISVPEKSIYDNAGRYNQKTSLGLDLILDNEGPSIGKINASTDEYGRVHGNEVDLDVTAKDESGIYEYEWQVSRDGKTWEKFITEKPPVEKEGKSEVIYNVKDEGVHHFRVKVTDILGNSSISKTESVNIITTMNRKPTIRFETQQTQPEQVKIIAIIKTTKQLASIKVNGTDIIKEYWNVEKTNNEITVTTTFVADENGIYKWTVVDEAGNEVTEEFNVTTIIKNPDDLEVEHKSYSATEYKKARIEFTANRDAKIIKVILNAVSTDISEKTSFTGMTFNTLEYSRKITVEISNEINFTPGTVFVFEDKFGNRDEVTVRDVIETKIMYVRTVSAGTELFNKIFGTEFDLNDAETLVNQMESKTKEINGSVKPYYGVSSNSVEMDVSAREDLDSVYWLSQATSVANKTLRFNRYGETIILEATIVQDTSGTSTKYQNNNITGVQNYERDIINYGSSSSYQTFRITIRAR